MSGVDSVVPAATASATDATDDTDHANQLPAADDEIANDDGDSGIGGLSNFSSTASLSSSMYEHVLENGRTYHKFRSGKYMLPNDEQEQERLEIQHALFTASIEGLHLAPLEEGRLENVLDMATGTGTWAIEFAQKYPSTRTIGTDLSAIQPTFVPANCRFEIDDLEDDWVFNERFDYIHGRALVTCFKNPPFVFQQAYNNLAPGGWFEMQDIVWPFRFLGAPPTDSALFKWMEILAEGAVGLGRPWTNVVNYKRWMEEIGLVDVVEKKFYWPLNTWAKGKYYKQISVLAQADLLNGLEGLSLKVLGSMGYSAEQVKEMLIDVTRDIKDPRIHSYVPMTVVYGRKPPS